MTDWPDDRMIESAVESLCWDTGSHLPYDIADALPDALSAALNAAPIADGWVWCPRRKNVVQSFHCDWDADFCSCTIDASCCPDTHKMLIVGPQGDA